MIGMGKLIPSWVRAQSPTSGRLVLTFLAKQRNINWGPRVLVGNKFNSRPLFFIARRSSDLTVKGRVSFRRNTSLAGKDLMAGFDKGGLMGPELEPTLA